MTAYRTIVADPPWQVGARPDFGTSGRSRPLTYPTMDVMAIASLPVKEVAAKRAHLYLWTINAYVEDSYEKPEAFLDMVESVSPGPYLELFARRARFGWDYAGDGSLGTAEIEGLNNPGHGNAA